MKLLLKYTGILLIGLSITSCKKFLETPSSKSLVIPSTLDDLQALLDRPDKSVGGYTGAGEESSDDYYLTDADYNAIYLDNDKRRYLWEKTNLFSPSDLGSNDWYWSYYSIYAGTAVLDLLPGISNANSLQGNYIKGQALFWRAFHYLDAAQVWTLPYDAATANTDLGLPLRLDPDFNETSVRTTLAQTYQQILGDLKAAVPLLITNPVAVTRASKQGAYALLARTCLIMGEYELAGSYADSSLQIKNALLDYNNLKSSDTYPIPRLNEEILVNTTMTYTLTRNNIAKIKPEVYALYQDGDLRKTMFFLKNTDESYRFRGSYYKALILFNGPTNAEMYLIRAEAAARRNDVPKALEDLNTLLLKRWDKTKTFIPYTANNSTEALQLVLTERRRELIMRGLRWSDIRRLNKEGANISQTRIISGQTYTLPPNDLRYALPIPEDVIAISGMPQNPR